VEGLASKRITVVFHRSGGKDNFCVGIRKGGCFRGNRAVTNSLTGGCPSIFRMTSSENPTTTRFGHHLVVIIPSLAISRASLVISSPSLTGLCFGHNGSFRRGYLPRQK
jgi:hypothetical protein